MLAGEQQGDVQGDVQRAAASYLDSVLLVSCRRARRGQRGRGHAADTKLFTGLFKNVFT